MGGRGGLGAAAYQLQLPLPTLPTHPPISLPPVPTSLATAVAVIPLWEVLWLCGPNDSVERLGQLGACVFSPSPQTGPCWSTPPD